MTGKQTQNAENVPLKRHSEDFDPYTIVLRHNGTFGKVLAKREIFTYGHSKDAVNTIYAYAVEFEVEPNVYMTDIILKEDCWTLATLQEIFDLLRLEHKFALQCNNTDRISRIAGIIDDLIEYANKTFNYKLVI